jgi:hypothetical protein
MGRSYVQPLFGLTQIGILVKMNCVGCNYQCWLKGRIGYIRSIILIEL